MYCKVITLMLALFPLNVLAHEMTPTYFEMKPSLYNNLYVSEFKFFNRREDVKYYEISVYDGDWNKLKFATKDKIFQVGKYGKNRFEVYIREKDLDDIVYVCTESKLIKGEVESSGLTSRICSKKK